MGFSMAELEMLPAWAGRVVEPVHPPQPPTPPRRYANETIGSETISSEANGGESSNGGESQAGANGHGPAVLDGQPPLPSGLHRLDAPPGPDLGNEGDEDEGDEHPPPASVTTSELPVVSVPFEDETAPLDELIDTIEAPVDGLTVVTEPDVVELEDEFELEDELELEDEFELEDELELEPAGESGEPQHPDGLLDDADHPPAAGGYLDEIVYEPDEIELLEETDPIGVAPEDNSPMVAPVPGPEVSRPAGREQEVERDRPAMRVMSLLLLAFVVVAAGVAAGYLFVAVTGG